MQLINFRVQNYRNVLDTGWIERINDITAFIGQNESGKSNIFEALYRVNPYKEEDEYDINEDWPVDKWGDMDESARICDAVFLVEGVVTKDFINKCFDSEEETESPGGGTSKRPRNQKIHIQITTFYDNKEYRFLDLNGNELAWVNYDAAVKWINRKLPKFVYIRDYGLPGSQVEIDELARKYNDKGWAGLSEDEQTVFIVLELAQVDLDEFAELGESAEGRTLRSFNKISASSYLTNQFQDLWTQKDVEFMIEIDHTTLNIFAKDSGLGMPVRLKNRSTGFRWHVSFAWNFTYASKGEYKNCILLLEEPGIHLHYDGQQDLIRVFERLAKQNQILYTTHLASMVDPAYPERVRIVETHDHHAQVIDGIVSKQKSPMAVIETRLGLKGNMGSLLGDRQTLIVEGGDDALILQKLSAIMRSSDKESLSDRIYLWPAEGAPKTPMYAGFVVGHQWDGGVLLDSDEAGNLAKKKITDLYLTGMATASDTAFRVFMLGSAAGVKKTDAAIEDLFPDEKYLEWVNQTFGLNIEIKDLPVDGSDMITKRVESVLINRYQHKEIDKSRIKRQMLKDFDQWKTVDDLPAGVAEHCEKLFRKINASFNQE